MTMGFDRTGKDTGNLVFLEHINFAMGGLWHQLIGVFS